MFCTFTLAPSIVCVCSSLISCFLGMLLRHCPSDFEMTPVAPVIYRYHLCFQVPHYYYYYCKTFTRNDLFTKITGAVKNHIFSCHLLTQTPYRCLFLYLYFSLSHTHTHTNKHAHTQTNTHTYTRAHKNYNLRTPDVPTSQHWVVTFLANLPHSSTEKKKRLKCYRDRRNDENREKSWSVRLCAQT